MNEEKPKIEFIKYDGEYPCLCYGKLTVKIGDRKVHFHYSYHGKYKNNDKFPSFWASGGDVKFDKKWNPKITRKPWKKYLWESEKKYFPEEIYSRLDELIDVMNEYVPFGCCGGCV